MVKERLTHPAAPQLRVVFLLFGLDPHCYMIVAVEGPSGEWASPGRHVPAQDAIRWGLHLVAVGRLFPDSDEPNWESQIFSWT